MQTVDVNEVNGENSVEGIVVQERSPGEEQNFRGYLK